jgi:hypothetical protein
MLILLSGIKALDRTGIDSVGILQRMSATKPHLTCIIYLQPSIVQHMILPEDTGFDGMTLALILYV